MYTCIRIYQQIEHNKTHILTHNMQMKLNKLQIHPQINYFDVIYNTFTMSLFRFNSIQFDWNFKNISIKNLLFFFLL